MWLIPSVYSACQIARDLQPTRGANGDSIVSAQIPLPADLTAGNYREYLALL